MEDFLKQVIGWVFALVVFALLFREAFESLISKPIVETLVGKGGSAKFKAFSAGLKKAQPFIVILLALAVAQVLGLDLVTTLNQVAALFPAGSMDTAPIELVTGVLLGVSTLLGHRVIREVNKKLPVPLPATTSRQILPQ